MKYKKYIFFLLLVMILGCNKTYAEETKSCFYVSSDGNFNAQMTIYYDFNNPGWHTEGGYTDVKIQKVGDSTENNAEDMLNWFTKSEGFPKIYENNKAANTPIPECPTYMVFRYCNVYKVWGTNDLTIAKNKVEEFNNKNNCVAYYATSKNSNGSDITSSQYYNDLFNVEVSAGYGGEDVVVDCDALFGSKDNPDSLRSLINEILQYPRIMVPILVILFGTIDFAKAVIAGKEDEMKKAQSTFIKRVVIGVAFFFIPVFVDIIMYLADIVWEGLGYTTCSL